jgi:hypothetical protein
MLVIWSLRKGEKNSEWRVLIGVCETTGSEGASVHERNQLNKYETISVPSYQTYCRVQATEVGTIR